MKLSSDQVSKIDPALKMALEQAEGHEPLRTLMVLGTKEPKPTNDLPHPDSYPDRTTYRKALIHIQQQQIAEQLSITKQELINRSLNVKGGNISGSVVVEGTANNILSSLDLPSVHHASLDKKIQL